MYMYVYICGDEKNTNGKETAGVCRDFRAILRDDERMIRHRSRKLNMSLISRVTGRRASQACTIRADVDQLTIKRTR